MRPEDRDAFAEAVTRAAANLIAKAAGYRRHSIFACRETPGRFVLHVQWETIEEHTVSFRNSPAFAEWRATVGPFLARPPHVEHFEPIAES